MKKDTKKEIKYFTIFEHEKEEEYLREKHKSGWKFVKVSGLGVYHFVKCEPEDVIYQLDYNKDGLAHKDEYIQMFSDCGWEYMQDYVGYSYFRKPLSQMNQEEEIFCDDISKFEMIDRVFKRRAIPLLVIFLAMILPMFFMSIFVWKEYSYTAVYAPIIILFIIVFIRCAIKRNEYKKRTK